MVIADYFFGFLAGFIAGILTASFLVFSDFVLILLALLAVFLFFYSLFLKKFKILLAAFILAGSVLGFLRGESAFLKTGMEQEHFSIPSLLILRNTFERALNQALPEPESSLASGIILGKVRKFPQDFNEAMRKTSTLHLIAVSGYNITVIAASILRLLEFLTIHRKLAWWLAVCGIILFTLFVGAPASAVRAAIMGFLVLLAKRLGRVSKARNALTMAAALMLLANPRLFRWDLGFQLSFLATIGIIYISPVILAKLVETRGIEPPRTNSLKEIFSDTLGAQIMVAPWILYKFGTLSLVGIFANILILPIIPTAMFFSFLTGLGGLFADVFGKIIAFLSFPVLKYVVSMIRIFADFPFASFMVLPPSIFWVILMYAVIAIIFFKPKRRPKNFSYA